MFRTINNAMTGAADWVFCPTPDARALRDEMKALPSRERWARFRQWSYWRRAMFNWPVFWRAWLRWFAIVMCFKFAVAAIVDHRAAPPKWDDLVSADSSMVFDEDSDKWIVQCHVGGNLNWLTDKRMAAAALKACNN